MSNEGVRVERYRLNDYVGAPIWGIRVSEPVKVGDRVWFDQEPLFPGERWYCVVDRVDGRLACRYERNNQFVGFIK
jgi:hypothetical protein